MLGLGAKAFTYFFATISLLNYYQPLYVPNHVPYSSKKGPGALFRNYLQLWERGDHSREYSNCNVIGAVLVMVKQILSCNDCSMCYSKREH